MGAEPSTQKKGSIPVYNKVIDKTKLEIILKKIFFTTQLQRDRKKGLIAQKEKELLSMIAQPKQQRNKESESAKASAIVSDVKTVKAQDAVMRYCDIVKDRALVIEMSKGDPAKISDLLPFIESIVWGAKNLNLDCVKELESFIYSAFGPGVYEHLLKGEKVQSEIKECFDSILPSDKEIKKFLLEFCRTKSIEVELMNEIGHNISEGTLADLPDNGNLFGGNGGGNGGGYPTDNSGGYGGGNLGGGGGYPGGGGGNIQVDPSKNTNINIGIYQPYQQQPYQQQQYQQQPYQQQPYQQQPYQQQPYQQQQYQPQQYQQQPLQQPTYQQQQPYQQPSYQQQQPYQQPTTQPTLQQPTYQPTIQQQQPYQDPKFQPFQPTTTTTTTNNNLVPTNDIKTQPLNFEPSDNSSYPSFKKMNIDPYQAGPKNDLDDFQNRLKRIKDGL